MQLTITPKEETEANHTVYYIEGHRGTANSAVKAAKKKFADDNGVLYRHVIGKKLYHDSAGARSNMYVTVINKMDLFSK